ncbi:MAG: DUF1674 domain-containing protein [Nevskia sp.]|nr:DUF1674 domain-containing protein [Nevskia sp.]
MIPVPEDFASSAEPRPAPERRRAEEEGSARAPMPPEIGGRPDGTEPTRYGDWEKDGRCIDF